jgi:cell division protein FtsB
MVVTAHSQNEEARNIYNCMGTREFSSSMSEQNSAWGRRRRKKRRRRKRSSVFFVFLFFFHSVHPQFSIGPGS